MCKTNRTLRSLTFDVIDSNPHGRIFSMRPTHSSTMSKLKNKKRNLEENEDEQVWFDIILIYRCFEAVRGSLYIRRCIIARVFN